MLHAAGIDVTGLTLGGLSNLEMQVLPDGSGQMLRLTFIPEPACALLLLAGTLVFPVRRYLDGR